MLDDDWGVWEWRADDFGWKFYSEITPVGPYFMVIDKTPRTLWQRIRWAFSGRSGFELVQFPATQSDAPVMTR